MNSNNELGFGNRNQQDKQKIPKELQLQPHENHQQYQGQSQSEGKRQFGCPCGKTYLSYPALFTHVKQKHDGRAPGKLIKPKTDKARGRPKIHVQVPEDDMSDGAFNFEEEIQEAIQVQTSDGMRSCQDMATSFMSKLSFLQIHEQKVIFCYLNLLRSAVNQRFGDKFWLEEKPNEIIDIVNDLCKNHENYKKKFPLEKQVIISLTYVLFRWMYKNKWTDHKLIRRSKSNLISRV